MSDPNKPSDNAQPKRDSPTDRVKEQSGKKSYSEAEDGLKGLTEQQTREQRALQQKRRNGNPTGTTGDFGTPEIPGLIKGRAPEPNADVSLARHAQIDKNYPRDIARQAKDALHGQWHPREGQDIFSFTNKPGAADACRSSESFAKTVDELRSCKWAGELNIKVHNPVQFTDYNAERSLIELDSKDSPRRQAEVFGHEGYHATHQDLAKLYAGDKPLSEKQYVDLKMDQEKGAFFREIMINEELRKSRPEFGNTPIEFKWVNNSTGDPQTQVMNDLLARKNGNIDENQSLKNIGEFLLSHSAARKDAAGGWLRDSAGSLIQDNYQQHYRGGYKEYADPDKYQHSQVVLRAKQYL